VPQRANVPCGTAYAGGVDRLTIKDVAKAAGVHPATASRALNPRLPGRISAETTRRVEQAAAELGYVVDPVGRSLRTQRSATIGVLVPDLLNPFYPPLLRGVERALRSRGFEALIASTDNDPRREAELLEVFKGRRCDGYIIATATLHDATVSGLVRDGVPVVLVNRLAGIAAPSVTSDDARGIRDAVQHLLGLGHTAIAHIAGPPGISVSQTREDAFRSALRAAGIEDHRIVRAEQFTAAAGERACLALLAETTVTAILAGNDMIAVGCYAALDKMRLRCPDDVSLVGVNNMPLAEWLRPSLTTVAIPQEDLGTRAAQLVVEQIDNPHTDVGAVTLDTGLIVRGSTAPAVHAAPPSA
jgi:LacI family transcriptional regulator